MSDNITLPREVVEEVLEALEHAGLNRGGIYTLQRTMLRTALAAEQPRGYFSSDGKGIPLDATKDGYGRPLYATEPTKPKPEPVAVVGTQSNEIWKRVYENWVRMPLPEPAKMVHLLRDLPLGTPLYTAPPEDEALRREET